MAHAEFGGKMIDASILDILTRERSKALSVREWKFRLAGYGYAINEVQTTRVVNTTCTRRGPRGAVERYACQEIVEDSRSEPLAIDLNAEQAKLVSLEERLAQMQAKRAIFSTLLPPD